jgi:two-component system chemotaxis sensor kinase CheA
MSIDMSQFHAVFIEECQEHLNEMEQLLMGLDVGSPDAEQLNSIFRAAHSIKGGSGIFGFEALIAVTHVMENLFDLARKGQYSLQLHVIDRLLQAVDALRLLVSNYADGVTPDAVVVRDTTQMLEALLAPTKTADEGFGFFDDASAVKTADIAGFGLFDDEPSASHGAVADQDESFGFFAPLPGLETVPSHQLVSQTSPEALHHDAQTAEQHDVSHPLHHDAVNTPAPRDDSAVSTQISTQNSTQNRIAASATTPAIAPSAASSSTPSNAAANKAKAEHSEASTVRVDIQKIDSLVNLVGELVITQSMLTLIGAEVQGHTAEKLQTALRELERNTREIQEAIMSIRMLPLSFVFNRFPRVVRDLSAKLKKQVELVVEGGNTEIDKGLIERLVDPLTHLVRNSLDHGIEAPATRLERGKNAMGRLTLSAEQKGGNIIICVRDDGAGLNRERIIAKALESGMSIDPNAPDADIWPLIMAPGFSTAATVTDVSGRGVGMDVVKRNIESMGGTLDIESQTGIGAVFRIRLPLTLAILDGMTVGVGDQLFIIPLVNIIESVQPQLNQLKWLNNQPMLELRNHYWPLLALYQAMNIPEGQADASHAILVLIETSKGRFALQVDSLIGQQQVVIKSLEQHYRRVVGVAGATIMGDGSVALILDVESLAGQVAALSQRNQWKEAV